MLINILHPKVQKYCNTFNYKFGVPESFGLSRNSNLAPLQKDTVSFSGRAKLISQNMQDAPSEYDCRIVSENAEPARFLLEKTLDKYIGPITSGNPDAKPDNYPSEKLSTRIKQPSSIREKVVSKYSKIYNEESTQFANQVLYELSQYFKINPEKNKDSIIEDIMTVFEPKSNQRRPPVYQNSAYYLIEIINVLTASNVIDFDSVGVDDLKKIFNEIVESLEDSAPTRHVEEGLYVDPTNISGIKYYANDIVGGRIMLRGSTPEYTKKIIEALKQAVNDGNLKIISIENNIPDPARLPEGKYLSDYLYATDPQLRSLAKAADAPLITNLSKTGYLAIHINIDLPSDAFTKRNSVFGGYKGEIQIIGAGVDKLKHIEDLCYKLKDNKNAIHAAYQPFKEHFLRYYNADTQDAFDEYTYAAYLAQRALPDKAKTSLHLPTIEELGFSSKLPKELDFNILAKIKRQCDDEYERIQNEQKSKSSKTQRSNQEINKEDRIRQVTSLISYLFN